MYLLTFVYIQISIDIHIYIYVCERVARVPIRPGREREEMRMKERKFEAIKGMSGKNYIKKGV